MMVIPIPARRAWQIPPTITGGDHHWWNNSAITLSVCYHTLKIKYVCDQSIQHHPAYFTEPCSLSFYFHNI